MAQVAAITCSVITVVALCYDEYDSTPCQEVLHVPLTEDWAYLTFKLCAQCLCFRRSPKSRWTGTATFKARNILNFIPLSS